MINLRTFNVLFQKAGEFVVKEVQAADRDKAIEVFSQDEPRHSLISVSVKGGEGRVNAQRYNKFD